MKKIFLGSTALIALTIFVLSTQISCKKETTTNTVTKTDTVYQCNTLTKEQILVSKTWKVDMVFSVINGSFSKYINGGINTTGVTYNNTRFLFNANGTGTYTNEFGTNYALTWSFTSSDKRNMNVNVPAISNNSNWEMVEIANDYLHFSVNFATNNMSTFRLKQI